MWVRLSRDTFSLQLHTAEPWIREFRGSVAKKRRGSPNMSFMIGLAEMRESVRMNVFTSFSCLSKCCWGDDRRKVLCADLGQTGRNICWNWIMSFICSLLEQIHSQKYLHLQLRCDDGVAHIHLPSISSPFGGELIVIRNRPWKERPAVFDSRRYSNPVNLVFNF